MQRKGGSRPNDILKFCNHLTTCSYLQPLSLFFTLNNYLNSNPASATYLSGYTFPVCLLPSASIPQSPVSNISGHPTLPLKKSLCLSQVPHRPSPVSLAVDTKPLEFRFSVFIPFCISGSEIQFIQ